MQFWLPLKPEDKMVRHFHANLTVQNLLMSMKHNDEFELMSNLLFNEKLHMQNWLPEMEEADCQLEYTLDTEIYNKYQALAELHSLEACRQRLQIEIDIINQKYLKRVRYARYLMQAE